MVIKFIENENNNIDESEKQSDVNNEFIRVFINSKLKKYLTFNELLTLCTSKLVSDSSNIIIKYIINHISISNNDVYIYNVYIYKSKTRRNSF